MRILALLYSECLTPHRSRPLPEKELLNVALKLGSDCPFFILNEPCYGTGRGEILNPISLNLSGYHILMVNPGIHINTSKAYSLTKPKPSINKLQKDIIKKPDKWKDNIANDFEKIVFDLYPEIGVIKDGMYQLGAIYSAMSGSGATVFGLFNSKPSYEHLLNQYYTFYQAL